MPIRTFLPACALTLTLALAAPAGAVDGTITINGEISDATCKINGAEPPYNLVVTLPKISSYALKSPNDYAGATPFTIKITNCPSTLSGQVRAYFEPGVTTDYDNGALYAYTTTTVGTTETSIPSRVGASKAEHIAFQLANPDGVAITLGADVTAQTANAATLQTVSGKTTKSATLRYLARYVRTSAGTISAGKLVSYVQYSIVYP
ncbi:fimbrial subunit [Bordetella trematum]|uniref:fimbrial protein n=1 Tax=Bordetella trematum TaxID=123899 RepID=UPI00079723F6|nr:fimbrial protein [Bordetella trematum]SAI61696.1 fimbrial subunit [Bordetella trematum]